jgi:DNA-binding transcriptional MerR regulator
MLMKVGELARSTGLTVRALHHYDEIGLLKPSGRSESGYRLYDEGDVARLHGIQALRQMGLSLAEIGVLYEGRGAAPQAIVEQQLRAIDAEIARARELRARLELIRDTLAEGGTPGPHDWIQVLQDMTTYGKYFSAEELKSIFADFEPLREDWKQLFADVQVAMARGLPADAAEVQSLARRWMSLMLEMMKGDYDKMERWGEMYEREPGRIRRDAPSPELVAYIRRAIDLRWGVTQKHLSLEELRRLRHVPESEWCALEAAVRALMDRGVAAGSEEGRPVLERWLRLLDRLTSGDRQLLAKLLRVLDADPLLASGSPLSLPARVWLQAGITQSS